MAPDSENSKHPKDDTLRSPCPLAGALDLLGDRWSLLVLRDVLFFDKSLFQEFLDSPEGISSNTLADRLKRLESHGVLTRQPYQERPVRHRYVPTSKGRDLLPLMREAVLWGGKHIPGAHTPTPDERVWLAGLVRDAQADSEDSDDGDDSNDSADGA